MARQSGKALSLDTPIPTPNGWSSMGEIEVGDEVYDRDGKITVVTAKSEVFTNHDCFKLTFDTKKTVIADADHLWCVNTPDWRTGEKCLTTTELFDLLPKKQKNGQGISIPISPGVAYHEQELPIDPYTLGVWLGDGYKDRKSVV